MKPDPSPPRCGHIGALSFTLIAAGGSTEATRPIQCRADATHLIDGQTYRCDDHLGAALSGEDGRRNWEVVRIDAPLGRNADAALTAAGAPCTLDRLQEWHSTIGDRVDFIAAQRDRLVEAFRWLDADPNRLQQVTNEIARARATAAKAGLRRFTRGDLSLDAYVDMMTPSVRQAIASLMAPVPIDQAAKLAEHDAAMAKLYAIEDELEAISDKHV